jgi:hypothetical protein
VLCAISSVISLAGTWVWTLTCGLLPTIHWRNPPAAKRGKAGIFGKKAMLWQNGGNDAVQSVYIPMKCYFVEDSCMRWTEDKGREVQRQRRPLAAGCCLDHHHLLKVCRHPFELTGAVVQG